MYIHGELLKLGFGSPRGHYLAACEALAETLIHSDAG
jgi:hypothetical protein